MSEPAALQSIEGTIERIVFRNQLSQWTVARLDTSQGAEPIVLVGSLPGISSGSSLRATGRWVNDQRYGAQFEVSSYTPLTPSTTTGIERYLGSGLVEGIGPTLAREIVRAFGLKTLEVIETNPSQLRKVHGIGKGRARRIAETWKEHAAVRQIMIFLQGHGLSPALSARIYKRYGPGAIDVVREKPYRLALEMPGVGFLGADRIARAMGLSRDAPERAEAGLLHVLSNLTQEGNVFVPRGRLCEEASRALEIEPDHLAPAVERLSAAGRVTLEQIEPQGPCVFLAEIHAAEVETADLLRRLITAPPGRSLRGAAEEVTRVEQRSGLIFAPQQREALLAAATHKMMVITGGPGVGKTTLIRALIELPIEGGGKIALAAPTGRAAKRLLEATGRPAQTLHRLLEFSPSDGRFTRDRARPLECDLLVVDEASMIDLLLFHALLRALPERARLVLVGDVDQLPSVGPGAVLRDIIDSGLVPVSRLTDIFRQAAASEIVVNAHRVNRGELPRPPPDLETSDFFFIERDDPEEAAATVCELVSQRIPERFGLDPIADIQVITPMHRGAIGVTALNRELQKTLNPVGDAVERSGVLYRVGDRIMQLRNDYERDVFNGDVGRVTGVDDREKQIQVAFDDRRLSYAFTEIDALGLAYACSVHKSQGSEYPAVVLALHTQHYPLLQRNLLYTALTRGRKLVVVVGSRRALAIATRNGRASQRFTHLAERLRAPARG